jgi:hypothetical protein
MRSTALLLVPLVGRVLGRDAVIAFEPAAEVDLRATRRAERPVLPRRRLAADRTRPRRRDLDRRRKGHCGADIITAGRFETARPRSRDRPRLRSFGRIGARASAEPPPGPRPIGSAEGGRAHPIGQRPLLYRRPSTRRDRPDHLVCSESNADERSRDPAEHRPRATDFLRFWHDHLVKIREPLSGPEGLARTSPGMSTAAPTRRVVRWQSSLTSILRSTISTRAEACRSRWPPEPARRAEPGNGECSRRSVGNGALHALRLGAYQRPRIGREDNDGDASPGEVLLKDEVLVAGEDCVETGFLGFIQ